MKFRKRSTRSYFQCVLVLFLAFEILPMAAGADPAFPCSDPSRCPDLITDPTTLRNQLNIQTRRFRTKDCAVREGETLAGKRKLLRLTATFPNIGAGDLFVGNPTDPANADAFEYAPCHRHYHFKEYADYRLWTEDGYASWVQLRKDNPTATASALLGAHPELQWEMVAGAKRGFCVVDVVKYVQAAPAAKYTSCGYQGISPGWADEYGQQLDGQWIDITGLPSGRYMLEVEVNAERFFAESNYSNNSAATPATIQ